MELSEVAPPGREKQVKALKKKFPGDKSAPYKIAWAQHNRKQVDESQTRYYKDDKKSIPYSEFYKKAREAKIRKQSDETRSDTKKHGVKGYDKKGSYRLVDGKKHYN